jgi:hypothetical protein
MSEEEHEPETAQEAFARMEGELALLRRAVERLAVERAELPEQPDYSETLAGMVQKIDATLQRADALVVAAKDGASPAMSLTGSWRRGRMPAPRTGGRSRPQPPS